MKNEALSPHFRAPNLAARKRLSQKITALTAYDYTTAVLLDRAGIDLLLVGDSLGQIVQGEDTTLPVTLDEMIYHCRCVVRGSKRAMVVGDLPFLSYEISSEQALQSAGRLVKEAGVHAVKLEGGILVQDAIAKIVSANIPLIGHIGLTPQAVLRMGGYKLQGQKRDTSNGIPSPGTRERVLADAIAVEEAGAAAVVLECIPAELAAVITKTLRIPTIGIGAGPSCDGQILVAHDLLGFSTGHSPKFVKRYADLGALTVQAAEQFILETRDSLFPSKEYSYSSPQETDQYVPKAASI